MVCEKFVILKVGMKFVDEVLRERMLIGNCVESRSTIEHWDIICRLAVGETKTSFVFLENLSAIEV